MEWIELDWYKLMESRESPLAPHGNLEELGDDELCEALRASFVDMTLYNAVLRYLHTASAVPLDVLQRMVRVLHALNPIDYMDKAFNVCARLPQAEKACLVTTVQQLNGTAALIAGKTIHGVFTSNAYLWEMYQPTFAVLDPFFVPTFTGK